ncbi:hypothetical protein [Thalassolituus oleivorans]|uniref:hypothetical protein n=1 Tax=Thalassolituus oleivorans TaxID=187493 RepID=UPI0023F1905E|nr:hypothetical protein [Thalassolituus oleivorans]
MGINLLILFYHMENANNRFKLLVDMEGVKLTWLAAETGIERERWNSVKHSKARMAASEIEALDKVWPEYSYWLATGKELPEAGQISPMTKRAHRDLKTGPQAG